MTSTFGITYSAKTSQYDSIDELMADVRKNYQGKVIEISLFSDDEQTFTNVFVSSDGEFFTSPSKEQPYSMDHFLLVGELVTED